MTEILPRDKVVLTPVAEITPFSSVSNNDRVVVHKSDSSGTATIDQIREGFATSDEINQILDSTFGYSLIPDSPLVSAWTVSGSNAGTLSTSTDTPINQAGTSITLTHDGTLGSSTTNLISAILPPDEYRANEPIAFSFWAKGSVNGLKVSGIFKESGGTNTWLVSRSATLTTSWVRYTFTGTPTSYFANTAYELRVGDNALAGTFFFYGLKLERGSKATPLVLGYNRLPSLSGSNPGDIWRSTNSVLYKDNSNTTRTLLNNLDNLSNLSNLNTARSNLGVIASKISIIAANYTVTAADAGTWFDVSATTGSNVMTLPTTATAGANAIYSFRKSDVSANTITLQCTGSDTILGQTTYVLSRQRQSITLVSGGNNSWYVVSAFSSSTDPNTLNGAIIDVGTNQTISGTKTFSAPLIVSNTTASTSTTTGSARFAGGVGVAGTVNANALALTTALPITSGGTGGNTAASARTALGSAASGANSDITSLTGLTTALSVGQGGTGATTAAGARTALSAASSGANSDITSLSGLTTALSIAQGGTGGTSASTARTNLGLNPATAQYNASQLQGQTINTTAPTENQILIYQSGQWRPLSAIQLLTINQGTANTQQILTSATLVAATGLSVTVTPKSASSYFEIILHINGIYKQSADTWLTAWLRRGATNLAALTGTATFNGSTNPNGNATVSFTAVDFPATTSAVTYSIWVGNGAGTGQVRIQSNNENSVIVVKEYVG